MGILNDKEQIEDVIRRANDFVLESSKNESAQIQQRDDLVAFSGNFWTDRVKKQYKRQRRTCLHHSCWPVLANQVVSKFTDSGWHVQLKDSLGELQENINSFESLLGSKNAQSTAFLRAVACGAGFVHVLSNGDNPTMEVIKNHTSVFIDPWAQTADLSDANGCVIVNFISQDKARSEYNWVADRIQIKNSDVWNNGNRYAALVTYYEKRNGVVYRYDICGDWVEETAFPLSIIPVVRFAGYETYDTNGVKYVGIVRKTWDLQLTENIAFSTLQDRMSKQVRSLVAMSVQSMGSGSDKNSAMIMEGISKCNSQEGFILPYDMNGGAPTLLTEHFETTDIANVISNCRTLMEDATGIHLQGMDVEKTATEVLTQDNSQRASVTELYLHAEMASQTIAKIVISLLNGGVVIPFELENGPSSVTTDMKRRQELALVAQYASDESKPYIGYKIAQTCRMSDEICNSLRANLGDFKIVDEEVSVGAVAGELVEKDGMLMEAIGTAEQMEMELQEAKMEAQSATQALESQKESFALERQKMALDYQQKELEFKLKIAELTAKCQNIEADTRNKNADADRKELENAVDKLNVAEEM